MSANLLEGIKPVIPYPEYGNVNNDGIVTSGKSSGNWYDVARWQTTLDPVSENQTLHLAASFRWHTTAATNGHLYMSIMYADSAENSNTIDVEITDLSAEWQRKEATFVLPSGMHITDFHVSTQDLDVGYDVTAPTLSYGSQIVLARAEVTLVGLEYVEGATFDEYRKERSETEDALAQQVSGISETQSGLVESTTSLTQRADGWDASVTRVEAITDQLDGVSQVTREVTDWARLDASDVTEPALEIGTTASDFKERLSNRRLRFQYKGDDVLTLDGESSTVSAARVRIGAYEWRPTNEGRNLSLVYVGGEST